LQLLINLKLVSIYGDTKYFVHKYNIYISDFDSFSDINIVKIQLSNSTNVLSKASETEDLSIPDIQKPSYNSNNLQSPIPLQKTKKEKDFQGQKCIIFIETLFLGTFFHLFTILWEFNDMMENKNLIFQWY